MMLPNTPIPKLPKYKESEPSKQSSLAVQRLIELLNVESPVDPDEPGITDAEWERMLKKIYDKYQELISPIGVTGGFGVSRQIPEQQKVEFAVAMMRSIGRERNSEGIVVDTNQDIRNFVRDMFKNDIDVEKYLPKQIWEIYPDLDTSQALQLFQSTNDIDTAKNILRSVIPYGEEDDEQIFYKDHIDKGNDLDENIEILLENFFDPSKQWGGYVLPESVPGVGEHAGVPVPKGYGTKEERFLEKGTYGVKPPENLQFPKAYDEEFVEKASDFALGKIMQSTDYYEQDRSYSMMGKDTQKHLQSVEKGRLSNQYDLEKALGSYNDSYYQYIQDYVAGKVKPWSDQQWGVAMQNIQNVEGFGNYMTPEDVGVEAGRTGMTTEKMNKALDLTHAVIQDESQVVNMIANKEFAGVDEYTRSIYQPVLIKELRQFIGENMGKHRLAVADPSEDSASQRKIMGQLLFNEWKDRKFNWKKEKSPELAEMQKQMTQQGFKLGGI